MCRPHVRGVPFSKTNGQGTTRQRHTHFERRSRRLIRLSARMKKQLALLAFGAFAIGCRDSHASSSSPAAKADANEGPAATKITVVYGSEKKTWLERELTEFGRANPDVV